MESNRYFETLFFEPADQAAGWPSFLAMIYVTFLSHPVDNKK